MAAHVGKTTTFTAQGKEWTAQRWERGDCYDAFLAWAVTKLPDPSKTAMDDIERLVLRAAAIAIDPKMTPIEKQILLAGNTRHQEFIAQYSQDVQNELLAIDSPAIRKVMNTEAGSIKMLQVMLKKAHGDVDDETAAAILNELSEEGIAKLFDCVAGVSPPKAPAPSQGPSTQHPESPLPGVTSTKNLSAVTPD